MNKTVLLKLLGCALVLGTFNSQAMEEAEPNKQIDASLSENNNIIINNVDSLQSALRMQSESFDSLLDKLNSGDFVNYYQAANYFYRKITKKEERIQAIINSKNKEDLKKVVNILSTIKNNTACYNKLPYGNVSCNIFDGIININEEHQIITNTSYIKDRDTIKQKFKKECNEIMESQLADEDAEEEEEEETDTIDEDIETIQKIKQYIEKCVATLQQNNNEDISIYNAKMEILRYIKDWLVSNQNNFVNSEESNPQFTNKKLFIKKFNNISNEIFNNIWNTNFLNNSNEILTAVLKYLTTGHSKENKIRAIHNFLRNIGGSLHNTVFTIKNKEFFKLFIKILRKSTKFFENTTKYIVEDYCEDVVIDFYNELKSKNIHKKKRNYSNILAENIKRSENTCVMVFDNILTILNNARNIIDNNDWQDAMTLIGKYQSRIKQLFEDEIKELKQDSLNYYIRYYYVK